MCSSYTTMGSFTNFYVQVALTQQGLDNYEKVVETVFEYLHLLMNRGP